MLRTFLLPLLTLLTVSGLGQTVRGRVVDAQTKSPVEFAHIFLIDLGTGIYADSAGRFQLTGTFPPAMKVRVGAHGYADAVHEVMWKDVDNHVFELVSKHEEFDAVTVSTSTGVLQNFSITNVESHSLEELNAIPATNLGDAMTRIPGVYNNSTGTGISKPVIRGLSGIRVVTYLNNLRIENQQWGGDHGMGVTDLGIGRVEVIKGPSSLLYGADALGGVAYFIDEDYADANSIRAYADSRFESNSALTDSRVGFKLAKKNVRFNLYGDYTSAADFKLPNNKYVLNSRYESKQAKAAFGINRKMWVMNIRYNYLANRVGIPGHTHDSLATADDFMVNQRSREKSIPAQEIRNSYLLVENKFFFKRSELRIALGNTVNRLQEYEEKWTIPAIDMNLMVNSYNVQYRQKLGQDNGSWRNDLVIGAQGMHQLNSNEEGVEEVLIPDAYTLDNGAYVLWAGRWKRLNLQAGVRYDNRSISTRSTDLFQEPFEGTYHSVNYSAGLSQSWEKMKIRLNASSGFRAPHISELLADGVHHGSLRYEIGDRDLKTEQAHQLDLAYELTTDHLSFIVNPFFNRINRFIAIVPQDSLTEGLPTYRYTQLERADFMGFDLGVHYHPHFAHRFHLEASYSFIYAEDEDKAPLPLIPPGRVSSQLKFQFGMKSKLRIEDVVVQYQYYFPQERVVSFEQASSGYHLLDAGVNVKWDLKLPLSLRMGVKNALNQEYIDHLSRLKNLGLPGPGINVYAGLRVELNQPFNRTKENE